MMTHSQIEFVWNRTDEEHEQSSWYIENVCSVLLEQFSFSSQEWVATVFRTPVHWTENFSFWTRPIWEPMSWRYCTYVIQRTVIAFYDWNTARLKQTSFFGQRILC